MRHDRTFEGPFSGPVAKLLPEDFDENLVAGFFNGSDRAVEALTQADMRAPIDLVDSVLGKPNETVEDGLELDGGGAKPTWSRGGSSDAETDGSTGGGGKGNGRKKKVATEETDPIESADPIEPAPAPEPEPEPDVTPEPEPVVDADYVTAADRPDAFNISVDFLGTWSDELRAEVIKAAEQISSIVIGDTTGQNGLDDFVVTASLQNLDGVGGYYGWGGTTATRSDGLSSAGYLRLDTSDLSTMENYNLVDDFAFHEILHAMGFGVSWTAMGLVETIDGSLRFTGQNAIDAYNDVYASIAANDPLSAFGVPVEMEGGSGTAGVHWDHDTFGSDMMSSNLNTSRNVISDMTIAALEDMGYETIYGNDPLLIA